MLVYGTGFADPGFVAGGIYHGFPPVLGLGRQLDPVFGRFQELVPLVGPFTGTGQDVPAPTAERVSGLWTRWGRVGYGPGARPLDVAMVRPMEWKEGLLAHGLVPAAAAGAPQPAPGSVYVGVDGQIYKLDGGRWWQRKKPGSWSGIDLPPRDVELQAALVRQLVPKPVPVAGK
jgi:hypothetical protein